MGQPSNPDLPGKLPLKQCVCVLCGHRCICLIPMQSMKSRQKL